MSMEQVISYVSGLPGALVLSPREGSEYPELSWGDSFFYNSPSGEVPKSTQPYGTIITKDYPDDMSSALGPGRWRVNIHVGTRPVDAPFFPHPLYGRMGWVSAINPSGDALATALNLLRDAHDRAGRRRLRPSAQ